MIKALIFDWGDTIMRDFPDKKGPMSDWDWVEYIPFAKEALNKLKNEYICCIATGTPESNAEQMIKALKRVGAERFFDYYCTSRDLGYNKPDVKFFLSVANKMNILPDFCVMIGNIYEKDIVGAKAAGMKTILFNEKNIKGDFIDADFIITSLKELPAIVEKLNK